MRKIIIYTDGASRANPGPAAMAVVICNEKEEVIKRYSQFLGRATNNEAEYQAVIFALKKIKALFGKKKIRTIDLEIRSDSELLINQLKGRYKILDSKIQPLFLKVWNLKIDFGQIKFNLIPREKNKEADRLVNEVLDERVKNQTLF